MAPTVDSALRSPPLETVSAATTSRFSVASNIAVVFGAIAIVVAVLFGARLLDEATSFDGPGDWRTEAGSWSGDGAELALDALPSEGAAMRTAPVEGSGPITVEVTNVGPQAGLAFRVADVENFWSVRAVPAFGAWSIGVTIDGKITNMGNSGVATMEGATVTVDDDGSRIRVLIDGDTVFDSDDERLADHQRAGPFMAVGGDEASSGVALPIFRFTKFG